MKIKLLVCFWRMKWVDGGEIASEVLFLHQNNFFPNVFSECFFLNVFFLNVGLVVEKERNCKRGFVSASQQQQQERQPGLPTIPLDGCI